MDSAALLRATNKHDDAEVGVVDGGVQQQYEPELRRFWELCFMSLVSLFSGLQWMAYCNAQDQAEALYGEARPAIVRDL